TLYYDVSGPLSYNGSVNVNSGTLPVGDTLAVSVAPLDLTDYGMYNASANIGSSWDIYPGNDSLSNSYQFENTPLLSITPPSPIIVSSDSTLVNLSAQSPLLSKTVTIGTGNVGNAQTNGYPCPLQDYYEGGRAQYLYLASELTSLGMSAG